MGFGSENDMLFLNYAGKTKKVTTEQIYILWCKSLWIKYPVRIGECNTSCLFKYATYCILRKMALIAKLSYGYWHKMAKTANFTMRCAAKKWCDIFYTVNTFKIQTSQTPNVTGTKGITHHWRWTRHDMISIQLGTLHTSWLVWINWYDTLQ